MEVCVITEAQIRTTTQAQTSKFRNAKEHLGNLYRKRARLDLEIRTLEKALRKRAKQLPKQLAKGVKLESSGQIFCLDRDADVDLETVGFTDETLSAFENYIAQTESIGELIEIFSNPQNLP